MILNFYKDIIQLYVALFYTVLQYSDTLIYFINFSRFGEESLRCCEVMLRDIEESKRVNNAILFELKKDETVS